MNIFQSLPMPLQEALVRMQYNEPTPIQMAAIPVAMAGRDLLGSAQTGTGKTAAFAIPAVAKLMEDKDATMLVLTPTRELAEQVINIIHQLLNKRHDIKTALLIGGVPIHKQFLRLKARPRVIVGTPGRINDHLDRNSLSLKQAKFLVLDEADRMLDMGFGEQLAEIAKHLPQERQTFMFSATLPKRILALSEKFLNNPERIKIGATHAPISKIKQDIMRISSEEGKYSSLLKELDLRTGSILIFAKTKRRVDMLAKRLNEKVGTGAMHGDLRQHQRTRVLNEFRDQKYRILVATDVAARGLDIPHIEHVINYDLPQAPEDYIHRIGRTARGDAQGSALCFISREDEKYWRAIERLLGGDESAPAVRHTPSRGRNKSSSHQQRFNKDPKKKTGSSARGRFSTTRSEGEGQSAKGKGKFGTGEQRAHTQNKFEKPFKKRDTKGQAAGHDSRSAHTAEGAPFRAHNTSGQKRHPASQGAGAHASRSSGSGSSSSSRRTHGAGQSARGSSSAHTPGQNTRTRAQRMEKARESLFS